MDFYWAQKLNLTFLGQNLSSGIIQSQEFARESEFQYFQYQFRI